VSWCEAKRLANRENGRKEHVAKQPPCQVALDVSIEDLIELGFCRFLKARMQRIACLVNKVVEPVASPALQSLTDFSDESVE
jgi:hypothetical protein